MKEIEVPKIYSIKKTDKETLKKWLYLMTLGRAIDDKAPNYLKQAIGWSYHAPYAGHDGIQLAVGQVFEKKKDHIFLPPSQLVDHKAQVAVDSVDLLAHIMDTGIGT